MRQPNAAFVVPLPDRCYCKFLKSQVYLVHNYLAMDCASPWLVVATANRRVLIYDLAKLSVDPQTAFKVFAQCFLCLLSSHIYIMYLYCDLK